MTQYELLRLGDDKARRQLQAPHQEAEVAEVEVVERELGHCATKPHEDPPAERGPIGLLENAQRRESRGCDDFIANFLAVLFDELLDRVEALRLHGGVDHEPHSALL